MKIFSIKKPDGTFHPMACNEKWVLKDDLEMLTGKNWRSAAQRGYKIVEVKFKEVKK